MKKLIKFFFALLAVVGISTSCNDSSDNPIIYTTIGTVVQGSSVGSVPYYVVFDDGVKGYIDNISQLTSHFDQFFTAYETTEMRFLISYTILENTPAPAGFDRTINLSQTRVISTDKLERVGDSDFQGEKGLQTYTGDARVDEGYYAPAMNYITLLIVYPINNETIQHRMRLVYNGGEGGNFKQYYKDDGYLWLELYHHNGGDSESYMLGSYASYKINERSLGVKMTDYKGVKIISKGIDTAEPHIFTMDFGQ